MHEAIFKRRVLCRLGLILCVLLSGWKAAALEISYQEYLQKYRGAPSPQQEVIIYARDYQRADQPLLISRAWPEYPEGVLLTPETGSVEWDLEVAEAGFYNIEIEYYPIEGRRIAGERSLWINGELPFSEAEYLVFPRLWGDQGEIKKDHLGNEIRPPQVEKPQWRTVYLSDSLGYHPQPFQFFFKAGLNQIRLTAQAEPLAINRFKISQAPQPPDYSLLKQLYQETGYRETSAITVKIQGQDAICRSEPILFPVFDQGDPTVEPYHPAQIRLNSIGGHRWAQAGQWITWEFTVPESGLYQIAIKAKQDQKRGALSNRKVYLNGAVPVRELEVVRFPFSQFYNLTLLGSEENEQPYLFYLEKGRNEITLEVVLGDLSEWIRLTRDSLYELTSLYREIIMITSATPDPLRDYDLEHRIPQLFRRLGVQRSMFLEMQEFFQGYTGQRGGHTELLNRISHMLGRMIDRPHTIPRLLGEFRDNVGALGAWISETERQPLQIDYLLITSPDQKMPKASPTFLDTLQHEIKAFFASFFHDYTSLGFTEGTDFAVPGKLKVWLGLGRDQGQILKEMIEDTFTPQTGITVELELINDMNSLLIPAIIAGTAPDVAIGAADMELAFRGAVLDLTQFPDFGEVSARFKKSALLPFRFRDKVYALPESQGFPMLFYRKDVLDDLGMEVPQTWDDVWALIPVLQRNNLDFGLEASVSSYTTFLYQKGVPLYKEDAVQTNLDSEAAVQSLRQLTDLFTLYALPLAYDVANRFRLGEMPLVIHNYGLYNTLQVFAPELRGSWGFAPVPGTRQPDGTINRAVPVGSTLMRGAGTASANQSQAITAAVPAGTTGAIILEGSSHRAKAWEFLKWWTREDTQARFGRELESLMGAAARYATANIDALEQLPWRPAERAALKEQWDWVEGIPPVLGGYYVTRQFDWLFRAVVLQNEPLRESILEYDRAANKEIKRKRLEFGLETAYELLPEEYKRLYWENYTHLYRLDEDWGE